MTIKGAIALLAPMVATAPISGSHGNPVCASVRYTSIVLVFVLAHYSHLHLCENELLDLFVYGLCEWEMGAIIRRGGKETDPYVCM